MVRKKALMEKHGGMTNYVVHGYGKNSSDSCLIYVLWKKYVWYEFASSPN